MKIIRKKLYQIIFHTDTKAGKAFDVVLLVFILLNVLAVLLESVSGIYEKYGIYLKVFEYTVTAIFGLEYILRVWISKHSWKYIFSFYGIVDLLSILPTLLEFIFTGGHSLAIIRGLRLLRLFRIFKLTRYTTQGNLIAKALRDSWTKISVFMFGVIMVILVVGTIMYLVEGPENGFDSIPRGIYWTIVTITTVGFGDITPQTTLGQFIASFTMILGYAIIAVPTGIVTVEMSKQNKSNKKCPKCHAVGHEKDARFCKFCGSALNVNTE
ncbi:MAG: ion transporter [Bacteroidota bacterium]|nr:ion transporter [Bacteroidota bacterium]